MPITAYIRRREYSPDGIIKSETLRKSDSFVKNFLSFLATSYYGVTVPNLVDTSGVNRAVSLNGTLPVVSNAGVITYGVLLGNGTTPTVADTYAVESAIPNGSGDGQLSYDSTKVKPVAVDGVNIDLEISRSVMNFSDVAIPVTELCLVGYSSYNYMLLRDIIDDFVPATSGVEYAVVLRTVV